MKLFHKRVGMLKYSLINNTVFIVLPCIIIFIVAGYYLVSTNKNNILNNNEKMVSQIKTNAEQIIDTANYASSMLIVNNDVLNNLRIIQNLEDSIERYNARTNLAKQLGDIESSILSSVGGRIAILTPTNYIISYSSLGYAHSELINTDWYKETLENGRKLTISSQIADVFNDNNPSDYKYGDYKYLYYARSILSYSGKCLGVLLIQISDKAIWGNYFSASASTSDIAMFLVDNNLQMQMTNALNHESYNLQDLDLQTATGVTTKGLFYNVKVMQAAPLILIFTQPSDTFFSSNNTISIFISFGILAVSILIILITLAI